MPEAELLLQEVREEEEAGEVILFVQTRFEMGKKRVNLLLLAGAAGCQTLGWIMSH